MRVSAARCAVTGPDLQHRRTGLYAASRADEYWIVDIATRAIEVYSQPVDGRYRSLRTVDKDGAVAIGAFPDVAIEVAALFP